MGAAGMGKKGHLPSLENVQGEIRFIYNILVRTKVPKSKHVSRFKIYLNCDCGRSSGPDPTGGANCAPSGPLGVLEIR